MKDFQKYNKTGRFLNNLPNIFLLFNLNLPFAMLSNKKPS